MISMYAEYSGRTLYVALSTDTIDGAKNGDTLYEMDTGKRYVYNEFNDAWDEQAEEGGGGGGGVEYKDVTFRCVNTSSSTTIIAYYVTENSGVPTANAQSLTLNTDITLHIQVVNGNIQMFSQSTTAGWAAYYNNNPLPMLPGTNRSLMFELPAAYMPGEIITLQH